MAVAHIHFDETIKHGRQLRDALRSLDNGLDGLNELLAIMAKMIDGDGSQAAHFTYMTGKFGFTNDAGSKAAYDELNSLAFKLNTNTSVTDVNAALLQAFSKFG